MELQRDFDKTVQMLTCNLCAFLNVCTLLYSVCLILQTPSENDIPRMQGAFHVLTHSNQASDTFHGEIKAQAVQLKMRLVLRLKHFLEEHHNIFSITFLVYLCYSVFLHVFGYKPVALCFKYSKHQRRKWGWFVLTAA